MTIEQVIAITEILKNEYNELGLKMCKRYEEVKKENNTDLLEAVDYTLDVYLSKEAAINDLQKFLKKALAAEADNTPTENIFKNIKNELRKKEEHIIRNII